MQVIMKGKLIPVFVLAALVSCSQPPVKEQGPRPVKLADVTSLNMVEKSFSGVVSPFLLYTSVRPVTTRTSRALSIVTTLSTTSFGNVLPAPYT